MASAKREKRKAADGQKCASRKYRSQPYGRAKTIWQRAKSRAALKGIQFSITLKWIQKRIEKGVCEVTGIKFDLECIGSKNRAAPSIDRKNVNLGYTPRNCRLVCWHFNAARSEFSDSDLVALAKAIIVGATHDRL